MGWDGLAASVAPAGESTDDEEPESELEAQLATKDTGAAQSGSPADDAPWIHTNDMNPPGVESESGEETRRTRLGC